MRGLQRVVTSFIACGVLWYIPACGNSPRAHPGEEPPALGELSLQAELEFPPSARLRSATLAPRCSLYLLVGQEILEWNVLHPERSPEVAATLPNTEPADAIRWTPRGLVVWNRATNSTRLLQSGGLPTLSIPPVDHPWFGPTHGEPVPISPDAIGVLPLNAAIPRRSATGSTASPLGWISRPDSTWTDVGRVVPVEGRYTTSVVARASMGGDLNKGHVWTLDHYGAVLRRFDIWEGSSEEAGYVRLPRYFTAPEAWEEVWSIPWLDLGNHQPRVHAAFHVAVASIPDSRDEVWTVRNGPPVWDPSDSDLGRQVYSTPGRWTYPTQWVEVYDKQGRVLGSYDLPIAPLARLDARGDLLLAHHGLRMVVVSNPLASTCSCSCVYGEPEVGGRGQVTPD